MESQPQNPEFRNNPEKFNPGALSAAAFREMALSYMACRQDEICFTRVGEVGAFLVFHSSFLGEVPT